ncbi:MAG: efflux RND transporter periplasmic adaptor subunit [bacterium]
MFEPRANLMRAIERAMEESVDQEAVVVYPPESDEQPVVARAHEALLAESEAGSAATFPLVNGDSIVGALTFERAAGHRFELPTLEVCEAVASIAGPVVELKQANEASLPVHAARSARGFWDRLFGPGYPGYKLTAIGVIALAAFLAIAEGTFRVSADSMVEGVVQRALTAPINGFVKAASLRAGDHVREGQVIAQLDDRELRLERAKLLSQRAQLAQQYREAMGKRERAQVRIVSAQIEQAEAQLALIAEQLGRTTLAAPFDGVIVRGDLSQSLGSPVERGEVLFEVAPLDDYRVVLQVDERDIGHVAEGQRGELTVTSMPGERFALQIRRITPVNTAKDGRNLFRVEAVLEAGAGSRLRPGMEGVGKIEIEQRKLVWIWTHGLTDWVRLKLWSWLP